MTGPVLRLVGTDDELREARLGPPERSTGHPQGVPAPGRAGG